MSRNDVKNQFRRDLHKLLRLVGSQRATELLKESGHDACLALATELARREGDLIRKGYGPLSAMAAGKN